MSESRVEMMSDDPLHCIAWVFIAAWGSCMNAMFQAWVPPRWVGRWVSMCDEIRSAENSVIDKASFSLRTEMRFLEILI